MIKFSGAGGDLSGKTSTKASRSGSYALARNGVLNANIAHS
ncbi:MAG: hypothetical protein PHH70_05715 [Candidatus Gracilibacteria bacterium]|nr:hypothetical protein [Candidatus Gracilibacteria bacterium]